MSLPSFRDIDLTLEALATSVALQCFQTLTLKKIFFLVLLAIFMGRFFFFNYGLLGSSQYTITERSKTHY